MVDLEEKRKQKIDANNIKIYDFFKNSININIPRYQREYSWERKNILSLINDVKKDYYIGNIIQVEDSEGINKDIIDGQQRIITIFLILIAIKNLTEDSEVKKEILSLIKNEENKSKLNLKPRIGMDGIDVLEFIIEGNKPPLALTKKYNEIPMYNFIYKELKSNRNVKDLYVRIKESSFVEISFKDTETGAHEMFVNVNTKGKPLELIEILKSQLFKWLLIDGNSDPYKEEWQNMLEKIPKKDHDAYCNDVYLLKKYQETTSSKNLKTSGTIKENCMELINSINSKEKAIEIFKFMTGHEESDVFPVYSAIKRHEIDWLKDNYYTNSLEKVGLGEIDAVWKLYKENGFRQGDIFFVTLFFKKENFLIKNSEYIDVVIKYIFMYEIYRAVIKRSPADYLNGFKQAAIRLNNVSDANEIKKVIKFFIKDKAIQKEDIERFKNILIRENSFLNSRSKIGKFLIMMTEDIYFSGLTAEHFILQNTKSEKDKKIVGTIGNLIPVSNDTYEDKTIESKIEKYKIDENSCEGIKNFLTYGFDKDNYYEKVGERSEDITNKFINKMNKYYERIMRG